MRKYFLTLVFVLMVLFSSVFFYSSVFAAINPQCCRGEIVGRGTGYQCNLLESGNSCNRYDAEKCFLFNEDGTVQVAQEPNAVVGCFLNGDRYSVKFDQINCFDVPECYMYPMGPGFASIGTILWDNNDVTSLEKNVELGTEKTFVISLKSKDEELSIKEVECRNCDGQEVIFEKKLDGNSGSLNIKVNSLKFVDILKGREKVFDILAQLSNDRIDFLQLNIKIIDFNCDALSEPCTDNVVMCFPLNHKCVSRYDDRLCASLTPAPHLCGQSQGTSPTTCKWQLEEKEKTGRCVSVRALTLGASNPMPSGYGGPMPTCVFNDTCNDVNDLLQLLVTWGKFSLGAVGAFAFVFFVYGGFTIITSFGNAERVKKGQQTLLAAVAGIAICLIAYLVIDFMLTAIGVDPSFRAIK